MPLNLQDVGRRFGRGLADAARGRSPTVLGEVDPASVREVRGPNTYDPTRAWYDQQPSAYMVRGGNVFSAPNSPGLAINQGPASLPDYLSGPGSRFGPGDEVEAARYHRAIHSGPLAEFAPYLEEAEREAARVRDQQAQATASSIATLQGAADRAAGLLEGFRTDPGRQTVETEFQRRASPDYRAVTPEEEAHYMGQIARAGASRRADLAQGAAAAGVEGPRTNYDDEALSAIVSAQGGGLQAQIAAANEQARATALERYAQYDDRATAIESDLVGGVNAIDDMIARVQAGQQFEPTDVLALANMQFGLQQYRDEVAFQMEALEGYEKSQQADLLDYLNFALSLIGTGIFA